MPKNKFTLHLAANTTAMANIANLIAVSHAVVDMRSMYPKEMTSGLSLAFLEPVTVGCQSQTSTWKAGRVKTLGND